MKGQKYKKATAVYNPQAVDSIPLFSPCLVLLLCCHLTFKDYKFGWKRHLLGKGKQSLSLSDRFSRVYEIFWKVLWFGGKVKVLVVVCFTLLALTSQGWKVWWWMETVGCEGCVLTLNLLWIRDVCDLQVARTHAVRQLVISLLQKSWRLWLQCKRAGH